MTDKLKFTNLDHGEIVILPTHYTNPLTGQPFDFMQLAGDHVILGLSTKTTIQSGDEMKTLRQLYEEQNND